MQRKSATWLCAVLLAGSLAAYWSAFSVAQQPAAGAVLTGGQLEAPAHLAGDLRSKSIRAAMRKVADAEFARAQAQPMSRTWDAATLDLGLLAATRTLGDTKYARHVGAVCDHFGWRIEHTIFGANDYAMAQVMIDISRGDARTLAAIRMRLDGDLRDPFDPVNPLWTTADALFFEPPAAVHLTAATGDPTYAVFVNREWHRTAKLLYDPQKHLYAQDPNELALREKNGARRFSARANGMAMAGLVRMLASLDSDDPLRSAYIDQLRTMAAAVIAAQGQDGLWRPGLLDAASYAQPDTANSALIVYALAWGINHRHLDTRSLPAVERAWAGLVAQIYENGRLGGIAPSTSAGPQLNGDYGVGAFLLAGSEVDTLSQRKHW